MKKIVLILFLFFITQPLLATSIVVLITSNYIIIGADSKRMIINAENNFTVNETVCKIRTVNDYCFASAGFVASSASGYSSDKVIKQVLSKTTSIKNAVRQIQKELTAVLQAELNCQKKHQPKQYLKSMESKDHLLEIVLLRVVNQKPQAFILGFEVENAERGTVQSYVKDCGTDCVATGPKLVFLGEYSGMEKYLADPHQNEDPAILVNQLILSQSKITPRSVGAPISLAKINAAGLEWIKQQCN